MKLHLTAASALAVAMFVALGFMAPATRIEPLASSAAGVAFSEPESCTNCPNCFLSNSKHKAPSGGSQYSGLHPDECIEQMPCGHPYCGGSALNTPDEYSEEQYEELRGLVEKLIQGDDAVLKTILAKFPEKVHLNRARHALQVEACTETALLSHVPLSDAQYTIAMEGVAATSLGE